MQKEIQITDISKSIIYLKILKLMTLYLSFINGIIIRRKNINC